MDALATLNCFGSMRTTHNSLLHKVLLNKQESEITERHLDLGRATCEFSFDT